jgi:hypothetical protein
MHATCQQEVDEKHAKRLGRRDSLALGMRQVVPFQSTAARDQISDFNEEIEWPGACWSGIRILRGKFSKLVKLPSLPGGRLGSISFGAFCIGVEPRHYWRGWIPSRCTIAPCSARATSFFLSVGSMRRWEANGLQKPRVSFDTSATNPLNCQNGYSVWY